MSSIAVTSFKWLDTLEKEFDKSFVDLDLLLSDLTNEVENGDFVEENIYDYVENTRDKVKKMCSAWSQLVHKSQTIFQVNCKLEAQILNIRSDLTEAVAFKQTSEKELEKLMIELHTAKLEIQKLKQQNSNTQTNLSQPESDLIKKKLEEELEKRFSKSENFEHNLALLQSNLDEFRKENEFLRKQIVQLNSEIYGARLAAKYLDKELAGRIQQIQLFGKNLKSEEHERLWNQLESEINLHRHKTVIKACQGKRLLLDKNKKAKAPIVKSSKKTNLNETRTVKLKRNGKEGLGISITGGNEHGVPILVSEIHENGPAHRSGDLNIGDAILSANGTDLKDLNHSDAVNVLSGLEGDQVELTVLYVTPEEDSDLNISNLNELDYPYFDENELLLINNNKLIETSNQNSQSNVLNNQNNQNNSDS